jgi:Tfp pilus assembly protein PilE
LFFTLFYTFNIACIIENIPAKPQTFASPHPSSNFFTKKQYDEKGFCGNTLVQTPYGYKPIKNLVKDDVVINCNGQEKRIVAITKKYVDQYVKIVVDNIAIYSGCGQCYYAFPVSIWFSAKRIWTGAKLFNNNSELCEVMHVELIYKKALLYCLTVEDHTFSIAPNGLCAHNAEAFILATSSICLGHVITINPIVATIGATVALAIIAHKAYQAYIQQCSGNDQKIALPTEVTFAERSYYAQRTTALETIKQELLYIKNGLENIKAFCSGDLGSFTYQFLKQTNIQNAYNQNQLLKISTVNEMQLSDKQKENLRTLREINLQHLEQEIINLQCILALHADELIKQINVARNECKEVQEQISNATDLWNDNLSNMTYAIALQSYKADLLEEHLLNNLNQKLNELKIVAQYYTNCVNTMCIEQSTNIIQLLERVVPVITEYDQWVVTEKSRVAENINVVEEHFARQNISVPHLKNGIKNELAKGRNGRNAQTIAEAKNKLASIAVSGGPNKYPKKK